MPRGRALSDFEKGQISAMSAPGTSQRAIVRAIERSKTVVQAYLRNPDAYNATSRPGRPSSLTPATVRRIVRAARPASTAPRSSSTRSTCPSLLAPCVACLHEKIRCAT